MNIQELCDLNNLLEKWKKEHAFSPKHYTVIDNLKSWIKNILKIKIANKEV